MASVIFKTSRDQEGTALSTVIDGMTINLVNISAIKGEATDSRNAIVGATADMVRTSVQMWKLESVTGRVRQRVSYCTPYTHYRRHTYAHTTR